MTPWSAANHIAAWEGYPLYVADDHRPDERLAPSSG